MKQGTLYAGRLKKAFAKFKRGRETPAIPTEPDDPLRRLAIGVLSVRDGEAAAIKALDRLFEAVVDWNEVRVSTPAELAAAIGNTLSDGPTQCQRLQRVLQAVFDKVNRLSLDHLRDMGVREARQYLEALDGVDEYAAAGVVLWSLGGHAIPVNDRLLEALRAAELVHPDASRAEVQAFLERNISAAEARTFCLLMQDFVPPKKTSARRSRQPAAKRKTTRTARSSRRAPRKR